MIWSVDWAALTEAGLYDPASPTAEDRRALLEFLVAQGCTLDEMVTANERGRLFGLAGDRQVRPGRDELTLREVADLTGVDAGLVQRLWQAYGLPIVDVDTKVASRDDASTVPLFAAMAASIGEEAALGLARVAAASVARFADAVSAALRVAVADLGVEASGSEATTARTFSAIAALTPQVGHALDVLLRHHLEAARRQFELSGSNDVALSGQVRLAVGFADMTGYTAMSQIATSEELARTLDAFELCATNAVHDAGGRVVKFIGDAVMYVHPLPDTAVAIARRLVDESVHPVRAGLSYGLLLAQDGDYFGPPVNLAARLTDVAGAGQVLVSDDLRARLDETTKTEPQPAKALRGIADPVVAHAVL
jgi:class 3 adenylate cyclase